MQSHSLLTSQNKGSEWKIMKGLQLYVRHIWQTTNKKQCKVHLPPSEAVPALEKVM